MKCNAEARAVFEGRDEVRHFTGMKMRVMGTTLAALFFFLCGQRVEAISLPPDPVNVAVKSGTVSFFDMTLSGVPAGYSVGNKTYRAWCVDRFAEVGPLDNGAAHTAVLLDVFGGGLPTHYADVPWDKVLYILNHKVGTLDDVQHAIWYYTDGISPDTTLAPLAPQMIADAEANGSGFVPSGAQVSAALVSWVSPNPAVQGNIIEVPGTPDVGNEACADRFTAGGFIYRDGSKVTFGIQGGVQNGRLWGGINFVDHGLKLHVQSRDIVSYRAIDANCREAVYAATIDGEVGTATVVVCDYGEPGRNDVVEITLSTGYTAGQGSTLGGNGNGGGNVQLHKGSCGEPPSAKPNVGGKPPKKPDGNSSGGGNSGSNSGGKGKDKGGDHGKPKGKGKSK